MRGQADSTKNHPAIDDPAIHLLFWRVRLAEIDGYAGSSPRMTSSSGLRCVRDAGKRRVNGSRNAPVSDTGKSRVSER
jgi:hypothetical protein